MSYSDCNPEWTEWSDCVNYERTRTKGAETESETCGEGKHKTYRLSHDNRGDFKNVLI